jgi:hypothetical protein
MRRPHASDRPFLVREAPSQVLLAGAPGSGDGLVLDRSRAIGGRTLHLAPGERRIWTFPTRADETRYVVSVSYSNSRWGPREVLSVELDGASVDVFEVANTGEDTEGWNTFAVHQAGTVALRPGIHTLVVQSAGGDGCVEIDYVSITPEA